MYSPGKKLNLPADGYEFPFQPYDIQQQLMDSLYDILENKHIGIFESPTGTGKSLTLTCAALRWLLDHESLVKEDVQKKIDELSLEMKSSEMNSTSMDDWITSHYQTSQKRDELCNLKKIDTSIEEYEKKIAEIKLKKQKKAKVTSYFGNQTKQFQNILEDDKMNQLSSAEIDLELEGEEIDPTIEEEGSNDEFTYKGVKIFFCSRTHSQLSQVVREVKRTTYGSRIRCVSLSSRQNCCIHPGVRKLPTTALINERCLDMAKKQSKATSTDENGCTQKKTRHSVTSCPHKNRVFIEELRDLSLVDILDLEDLVSAGEKVHGCPYYAARQAAKDAQLIMLPYQMLLHRKTRIQSGIDLQNSIVIIDEAHNLLDAISSIYSNEISLSQLSLLLNQIVAYKMRYCERFSTKNLLKINQIIFIVKRLVKMLTSLESTTATSKMIKTHELMSEGEFFNLNVFEILQFCENTRFAQKLQGFAQRMNSDPNFNKKNTTVKPVSGAISILKKLQEDNLKKEKISKNSKEIAQENKDSQLQKPSQLVVSPIRYLISFLESLMECSDDGRILLSSDKSSPNHSFMKFILLNPGGHFEEIIRDARAIIIAGGTMQPTAELTDQLFKTCSERVHLKFYDHVVSSDAVLPFVVSKGPTGKKFCFNFTSRNSTEMLLELGMLLQNVCNVIPAGIVCFFSSYDYLEIVYSYFQKEGILNRIQQKKILFREQRSTSGQSVEKLLIDYLSAIKSSDRCGALLFSVVGGKLSEGLNFSDDLGRCVIVVGMPYPNRNSPELQERMKYLDFKLGNGSGSEYYENLCMKAVNQCIGRSVRHINDYASILLIDDRYSNEKIRNKLPLWISRSLKIPTSFGMIQSATAKFFRQKKEQNLK